MIVTKIKGSSLRLLRFGAAMAMLLASNVGLAQICSTDANTAIPDGRGSAGAGTPATISIDVPAFYTNAITDLTFDLAINHTYVGDLIVTLQSPAGTTVTLMDRPGRPATTFGCSFNNVDATFDDASGIAVENECSTTGPAIQGVVNPQGSLSAFDGEIPAGTWTLTVTDNARQDIGTIIAASNCLDLTTVPVVLSSFDSRQRGRRLIFEWQTASEAFNLGFNLWGNIDGEWTQLNKRMIASGAIDSVEPLTYRRGFNINKLSSPPTQIGISSISSAGFEEFYGPFSIGDRYGETTVPKAIDWQDQRQQYAKAMRARGYELRQGKWRRSTERSRKLAGLFKQRYQDAWLNIDQAGVYRVTYEQLKERGVNYYGLPINRLALSFAGRPIARTVKGSTRRPKRFGPGGEIIFFAQPPQGPEARYADSLNVRLSADRERVIDAPFVSSSDVEFGEAASDHLKKIKFGQANGYSFIVPGDNPWFDEVIYAFGNIGTKRLSFQLDEQAQLQAPAVISLNLMGGTSFDNLDADGDGEPEPDHHYRVYLNRQLFPEPIFEGYSEKVDAVTIESRVSGQLLLGENTIELEVIPDNGHNIDAAYFLNGSIEYVSQNTLGNGTNAFSVSDDTQAIKFIDNNNDVNRVFATDNLGNFSELEPQRFENTVAVSVPVAIAESTDRVVWLTGDAGYLDVTQAVVAPELSEHALSLQDVDYVVIADESLIGDDLTRFVDLQLSLGRATKVVSVQDIYARYSEGVQTPSAIARYLKEQTSAVNDTPSPFEYVLLVGGHTYNYLGFNVGADDTPINLIPSFYRNGGGTINRQIPTAVPFVDFDADGSPDRAIGRWPVRDLEQLRKVVDKTIAWHRDGSNKSNQQALLIAQKDEPLNQFSSGLQRINRVIGSENTPWHPANTLFVSDILADDSVPADQKIARARDLLVDGVNQGPALTVYNGHASPTTWGRENLLTTSVVDRFTNKTAPTLIMPLACYTTYYETPKVKSLSERLFSDNAAGAVGLTGPALLSYSSENERFAKHVLRLMTRQGETLGSAVMKAKQAIHNLGERRQTVIYNWVTLADPTLDFALPIAPPTPVSEDRPKQL